jgi:hypothetical protein
MKAIVCTLAVLAILVAPAWAAPIAWAPTASKDIGAPPGDPAAVGSTVEDPLGTYTVTGGGDDWWDWAERGQIAYDLMPAGQWRIETNISVVGDPVNEWFKAGLFLRNDVDANVNGANPGAEREVNAIMASLRPSRNLSSFQWRPANDNSWMGNVEAGGTPNRIALQRQSIGGGLYLYEGQASTDGGATWVKVGTAVINNMVEQPYGGFFVTAHQNYYDPGTGNIPWQETAVFSNATIDTSILILPDPAMRTLALTPPKGGMGKWGVREVYNAGDVAGNLDDPNGPVGKINSGAGTIVDYQAPVINMHGSGGNGHYGNDAPYGVCGLPGGPAPDGVDNISMVASGTVRIVAADWYTFNVNSDDGFELAIDGTRVMQANYGKGSDDVLGQRYLTAGDHPIRLIWWEGGGGDTVEVSAARGFKGNWEAGSFNLIGGAAIPAVPPRVYPKTPGLTGNWDMVAIYGAGRDPGGAETDVRAYWADPATWLTSNPDRTAATALTATVCHRDPDDGWDHLKGHLTSPFPGQVDGVAEDGFIVGATGVMRLDEAATMTFITFGDDGSVFRIVGTDGLWYGGGSTGGTYTDLLNGFRFDGWNQDAYRTINLAADTDYQLELFWQEGGGGAHVGLFAMFGTYAEGSNVFLLGEAGLNVDYAGMPEVLAGLELVPEPATLALLGLGLAGLVMRRRRA